jgi:hypothetical protein
MAAQLAQEGKFIDSFPPYSTLSTTQETNRQLEVVVYTLSMTFLEELLGETFDHWLIRGQPGLEVVVFVLS